MFAPPVAKPQAKAAKPQRATAAAKRPSQAAGEQAQLPQGSVEDPEMERLLARRADARDPGKISNAIFRAPLTPEQRAYFELRTAGPRLPIQAKLKVGAGNDPLEHEADRIADQVMRMPAPGAAPTSAPQQVSRKCAECEEEEKLQRKEAGSQPAAVDAPASLHEVLRSPGQPLDAATCAFMEPRFGRNFSQIQTTTAQIATTGLTADSASGRFAQEAGQLSHRVMRAPASDAGIDSTPLGRYNFSQVRVHADTRAAESARAVNALAYTVGNHVVFGAGQYAPTTTGGKYLLAHELVHTLQQSSSAAVVQRVCDPMAPLLAGRTGPVFFPLEATIRDVFRGVSTLTRSPTKKPAVGLVQQALVDLGFNLGASGPNGDGVDLKFGSSTAAGITAFQTAETISGATADVLDQPTLKCLDDKRSKLAVPPHRAGTVTPGQVQISDQETGGRDEDISFDRGSSSLDVDDKAKIGRLLTRGANPLKGCSITLEGYVSEDELVDFGPSLATDRIDAVGAEFAAQKHDDPGPNCPSPAQPLRTASRLPAVSSGVSAYRSRRKVEVVPAGAASTTAPCPPGAAEFRTLTAPEAAVLKSAIDLAVPWMNAAIGELTPGDPQGDAALTEYFGGTSRRSTIKAKLITWRGHLDTVVRANNRHGTQCNAVCPAIAFNTDTGASAQMTVCPRFFQTLSLHPALNQDEHQAFVMMHEAGHGAIATRDTGYGDRRLIEFLAGFPAVAETNTDSYTLMVLCLKGFAGFCTAPKTTDTVVGLTGPEAEKSRRGLGWLQTWLDWTAQDTRSLYRRLNVARESGRGLRAIHTYYADVYDVLVAAFDVRRPAGDPPPTFSEQTTVAAVLDRLITMERAAAAGLTVEKDTSAPVAGWAPGPGRRLLLTGAYFLLTTDRERVENLLPLMIEATLDISGALEPVYETYIKENVRKNRGNKP
ncbi:MAG: eCIS core domain-containing protein [Beijerinckiaceae bacterium]